MSAENPYLNRDDKNHISDGEPRALYWYPYRQTYETLVNQLVPGQEVPGHLGVMIVGNNSLNPFHFDLKKKDRTPLCGFESPGISAHIEFSKNYHIACGAMFDRDCRRQDRLYIVPRAEMFEEINYVVVYLPTPNQSLHVRIVHRNHLDDSTLHLPPFEDRKKLAELFTKHQVGK